MKAKIGRKIYDTERSRLIHYWSSGKQAMCPHYVEYLYITDGGEYFLYDNNDELKVISDGAALGWMVMHGASQGAIDDFFKLDALKKKHNT